VSAACDDFFLRAINLPSLSFTSSNWTAVEGEHYFRIDEKYLAYYSGLGFDSIRLAVNYERLDQSNYLSEIDNAIYLSDRYGLKVIVDLHNYGKIENRAVVDQTDIDKLTNAWLFINSKYMKDERVVAYGLMNEPVYMGSKWRSISAHIVSNLIEIKGFNKYILISGVRWGGVYNWEKDNPFDYLNYENIVYEAHLYFDADHSGKYTVKNSENINVIIDAVNDFNNWLKYNNRCGFIGEIGVPLDDQDMVKKLFFVLNLLNEYRISWAYWAGGKWSKGYRLNLEFKSEKSILDMFRLTLSN
jgi:endoglucanase